MTGESRMAYLGRLALEVYDGCYEATESFKDDDVGMGLAYLMGAILADDKMVIERSYPIYDGLLRVLRTGESYDPDTDKDVLIFPPEHDVWNFIEEVY